MDNLKWINERGEYIIQPKVNTLTAHRKSGEAHAVSKAEWDAFDGIIDQTNSVALVKKFYNKLQEERSIWKSVAEEHRRISEEFAKENNITVQTLEELIEIYWSNKI